MNPAGQSAAVFANALLKSFAEALEKPEPKPEQEKNDDDRDETKR